MPSFIKTIRQVPRDLLKYPVELLLSVTFYVISIMAIEDSSLIRDFDVEGVMFSFPPLFVLTFMLNKYGLRIPYYLSYFLWIPLLIWFDDPGTELIIAYFLAALLLFVGKGKMDNTGFARNTFHVLKNFALAVVIGIVMVCLIYAILMSVKYLFVGGQGDGFERWTGYLSLFVVFVIVPMLSSVFVGERPVDEKPAGFYNTLLNYLLTPGLIIYSVILIAYALRVLFRWDLPVGGVAYMVLTYIGIAVACYLMGHLLEKQPFKWFYRWFPAISAPAVILLWAGSVRRIADYGFTEERVYLLVLVVLVTAFSVMMCFGKTRDFRFMTVILGVAAALFTYVPGISAEDIGIKSQQKRLEKLLPAVLEDGKFPNPDYQAIAADPAQAKIWADAADSYEYLRRGMDSTSFHTRYDVYGKMLFQQYKLEYAKQGRGDPDEIFE